MERSKNIKFTIEREVGDSCKNIKKRLKSWNGAIYWYPGSTFDLMPLALDTPNNCLGSQLFPVDENGPLFVPSDCDPCFMAAITGKNLAPYMKKYSCFSRYPYREKYKKLGQRISIDRTGGIIGKVFFDRKKTSSDIREPRDHLEYRHPSKRKRPMEIDSLEDKTAPAAIFFVDVKSESVRRDRYRRKGTDRYLFFAIGMRTECLWAYINHLQVPVETLAIVKSGGFTGHEAIVNELVRAMDALPNGDPCKPNNLLCDNSIEHSKYLLRKEKNHIQGWGYAGVDRYRFRE